MVTASRIFPLRRARPNGAGLWRVLWLAAVLLGVLYTHGVSGEIIAEHVTPALPVTAVSTTATTATSSTDTTPSATGTAGTTAKTAKTATTEVARAGAPSRHHGHTTEHSAQDCAAGQPQPGAELPAPDQPSPLDISPQDPAHAIANSRSTHADTAASAGRSPDVLRI